MYSAPRCTAQDCSPVEYSRVINNPTACFQVLTRSNMRSSLFPPCFCSAFLGRFVWQAHEIRPIKSHCHCVSISPLQACITINLTTNSHTLGNFALLFFLPIFFCNKLRRSNQKATTLNLSQFLWHHGPLNAEHYDI